MTRRLFLLAVAVGFALVEAVSADDNVRDVQTKLRDCGSSIAIALQLIAKFCLSGRISNCRI
jgi:hypothetical protein